VSFQLSPALRRMLASGALRDDVALELVRADQGNQLRQALALQSLPPGGAGLFAREVRRHCARTTVQLPDGAIGYYERPARTDDCFAACLATCLQVPIADVPDPRLDERVRAGESVEEVNRSAWESLLAWLQSRGLQMFGHDTPPVGLPRWIGVIPFPGDFNDHCLVMSGAEILFDPVDRSAHERPVRSYSPGDVRSGFSFQPADNSRR
jgi:hypothetical protein